MTRRALAIRTATLGARHPANAEVLAQLSSIRLYFSDLTGAEEASRRALDIRRESLRSNDPLIAESFTLHAAHLRRLGRSPRPRRSFVRQSPCSAPRPGIKVSAPPVPNFASPTCTRCARRHGAGGGTDALISRDDAGRARR